MSHVWLLNMKTDEAKKTLLHAGLLSVKNHPCLVADPVKQELRLKLALELRLKLHRIAFDVNAETIRRAFREYGEVRDVISDKWRGEDFEGVESTTRLVRLCLKEGVSAERIPHQGAQVRVPLDMKTVLVLRGTCRPHGRKKAAATTEASEERKPPTAQVA
ncbi:hypothetical protein HPB50_002508 [Hyalomma asiaticum]|uniref:Uncharacterized protein n=1 Tax=Hyalomma asiaticum TaxID=266040 RepID=A0ACB7SE11_HYAAI|nr:hypothetical protein HPB50_002508 [Hyalomma asiaticum]